MVEHLALWPFGGVVDRHHPASSDFHDLKGNARAFAQATWRHLIFGLVLGELERRFNPVDEFEPPGEVPVSSNGHGNIEQAAVGAAQGRARVARDRMKPEPGLEPAATALQVRCSTS